MSEQETVKVYEELRKKYPGLSDEAIADIMQTGAEHGLITKVETEVAGEKSESDESFDFLKTLAKGDADLDQIMRFMMIDSWIKERFGSNKALPKEVQDLIEKAKQGKAAPSDLDSLIDRMMKYEMIESFMEGRRARKQPSNGADVEKAIREMGEKMTEALRTHKLEDEKARAEERVQTLQTEKEEAEKKLTQRIKDEEEEKRLQARVPLLMGQLVRAYDERLKEIQKRLQNVTPDERKGLVFDLGEMISNELGNEFKERIVEGIKDAFGGGATPPITVDSTGKAQVDWYKLGERGLKTLEKFIERLPMQAPGRREVKELPKLPPATPATSAPVATSATSPAAAPAPATTPAPEKPIIDTAKEKSTETKHESAVASDSGEKS
jgi:hypothetical protein